MSKMKEDVLNFTRPRRVRSRELHNEMYQSDAGISGTYVPNMSEEDRNKWKARCIRGTDPRVEIRKTFHTHGSASALIVVRPDRINMSANGNVGMDNETFDQFCRAIEEARMMLER